jgi:hypothetical protein
MMMKHTRGNGRCRGCCYGHPEPCDEPQCTGFMHMVVIDEYCNDDYSDCYWLYGYKCDRCGSIEGLDTDQADYIKFEDET